MKNYAILFTAALTLAAASAASAGQINRGHSMVFRHTANLNQADRGYALTGEQTTAKVERKSYTRRANHYIGGRNRVR